MILRNIITLLILALTVNTAKSNTIYLNDAIRKDYIGKNILLFKDTSAKIVFEDVRNNLPLFTPNDNEVVNLGVTTNNNWLYFKLTNNTNHDKAILKIPNPIIDEVSLYIVRSNRIDSILYTNYTPLINREYHHQYYLFDIDIKQNETVECFVKMKSSQQILAPLRIRTEKVLISEITTSDTKSGIYLGIMLVMLFYNLFIYFTVRDKDYLVYCHYIFWVCLTQATLLGYSHRFLWTDNTWLASNMVTICGVMSGIATILFTRSFLRTKYHSKTSNKVLSTLIIIYLIVLTLLFIGKKTEAFQLVNMSAATTSISVIVIAWVIFKRNKYTPAKYFLLSWSVFFTSILVFVAKDYSLVPYNEYTVHAVEIGSALEALLLSFALAGKINILKKEKEISQAEALRISQENEKIIKEQNVVLEQRVTERTTDLRKANQELNLTIDNLKQTQSQLVEAEKMASLGQLTAGIAHEINNPINFVTANVSPLQRDVNMLIDTVETYEKLIFSDQNPKEKELQIEQHKEEIDYEYLKTEITYLLKGMAEGADRTAEIVKGLRIFSRVDEDDLKQASVAEGIDSTLIIMKSLITSNDINVITNYDADLPPIECYPGKLNQVFLNIISNAVYAVNKVHSNTKKGMINISIRKESNENIVVKIEDNGCGIPQENISKIFNPFFTTKEVGEGTGLGMSIAYNTIKKHHGFIEINSEVNKGTLIKITLPIKQPISETV